MDRVYNEAEQVDLIKSWIKEYLPSILVGVLTVIIIFFGWQYWHIHRQNNQIEASMKYEALLVKVANKDIQGAATQAKSIKSNYKHSPYAILASFLLAQIDVQQSKYKEAAKNLQWIIEHAKQQSMVQIAKNRLARIDISQKQADKALKILKVVNDKAFFPMIEAIRGDAYKSLNKDKAAYQAYEGALSHLPKDNPNWPLLQMKLIDSYT